MIKIDAKVLTSTQLQEGQESIGTKVEEDDNQNIVHEHKQVVDENLKTEDLPVVEDDQPKEETKHQETDIQPVS